MKKILFLLLPFFMGGVVFGQSGTYNNIGGKQNFLDSIKVSKYKDSTGTFALATDANGRLTLVARGAGGGGGGVNNATILLSGAVIWDSNFVFHNTALTYQILGRNFSAAYSTFTIPESDTTYPRYSVVYADTLGHVGVLNGVTGSPADVPQVNPQSQILLAIYYVPANATSPSSGLPPTEITNTSVYKENVEWILGGTATGVSGAYTTYPYAGIYSTRVPSVISGQYINYTNGATVSASSFSYLSMRLRLGATFDASTNLVFGFYLAGSPVSNTITLTSGSFGYSRTDTGYKLIAFGLNNFNFFGGQNFDEIRIAFTGANASGFQLDNVILQGGGTVVNNSGVLSVNGLTGNVFLNKSMTSWAIDSVAMSSDSLTYLLYNTSTGTGVLIGTLPTLKRDVIAIYPLIASNGVYTDTLSFAGGSTGGRYTTNGYGITTDSSTTNLYRIIADTANLSLQYLRRADSVGNAGYSQLWRLNKVRDSLQANINAVGTFIIAKDTNSIVVNTYPAGVYNVAGSFIGVAYNQNEAVTIWNANATNAAVGVLTKGASPFSFNCTGTITQVTLQPQVQIGTVFYDDFKRGYWGANYDTASLTSAATFSSGQVKLYINTIPGSFANIVKYIGAGKLTSRNFEIKIDFRPCTLGADTYGPIIGAYSTRNPAQNTSSTLYPDFSTNFGPNFNFSVANSSGTLTNKATIATLPTQSTSTIYTMDLTVHADTATGFIVNRKTSEISTLKYIYDFTNTTQTGTKPNIFYPSFGQIGRDSVVIYNFSVYNPDLRYVKMLFVGNSITTGYYGGMARNGFPDQLKARTNYDIQTLAGGYNRTADVIDNLTEIINEHPENALIEIGTNDRGNSVPQATIQANFDTINNRLVRAGIRVYWLAAPDAGNPLTVGTDNYYLRTTYGANFIDTWTGCYGSGQMVDAVHPNQTGFRVVADTIQSKLPLLFPISGKRNENYPYYLANTPSLDQVLAVGNTSATRINITGDKTTTSAIQVGSIEIQPFATNNNWFGDNMYYNAGTPGFKYRNTGYGTLIQNYNGQILMNNFTTHTAGTTATGSDFKTPFKSDYSGNTAIGGNIDATVGSFTGAKFLVNNSGVVGVANNLYVGSITTTPTALLHLKAGTATANTAPLKLTSGVNLSTTEAGAIEYDGSHLYFTAANAGTRYQLDQQAGGGGAGDSTYFWNRAGNYNVTMADKFGSINNASVRLYANNKLIAKLDSTGKFFADSVQIWAGAASNGAVRMNNIGVGDFTLKSNTSGYENTAVGDSALRSNTTGFDNVAVGALALQAHTTGIRSTALGSNALFSNTSGTQTGVGYGALYSNTGSGNTAIGNISMYYGASGNGNVAVGESSLSRNTADFNVAVGYQTLANNTSGTLNMGIGYGALGSNTTGGSNSAIGGSSLGSNKTKSNNTAIGLSTMYGNINGTGNTAIGANSLYYNSANGVLTLGSITGGSGYTNGTYNAVTMTLSSGTAMVVYPKVNVTVSGGAVTALTIINEGISASLTTVLTIPSAQIGGTGSGFSVTVASIDGAIGDNNIAIGSSSGNGLFSGSSNIIIGSFVDPESATANGQINIGNVIKATGSYNGGTPSSTSVTAPSVAIGGSPVGNKILGLISTTQAFAAPRMTTTQKNAIATPTEGDEVYDLTLHQKSYYNGTTWINY